MNLLLATTILPSCGLSGGEIVTENVIQALQSLGHSVTVVGYKRKGYVNRPFEIGVDINFLETEESPLHAFYCAFKSLLWFQPFTIAKYKTSLFSFRVKTLISARRFDAVIIDHVQMAWIIPYISGLPYIHLSHNNECLLYKKMALGKPWLKSLFFMRESHFYKTIEYDLLNNSVFSWILNPKSFEKYQNIAYKLIPIVIPSSRSIPLAQSLVKPSFDVVLLGNWTWMPNKQSLIWFFEKVCIHLYPHIKIAVAGKGSNYFKKYSSETILLLNWVLDPYKFLSSGKIIAVPSIAGDGIQIKTIDAIAVGRHVVVSEFATRGIRSDFPERVHVASSSGDFAAKINKLVSKNISITPDAWAVKRIETLRMQVSQSINLFF